MKADLGPNRLRTLQKLEEMLKEGEKKRKDLEIKWDEILSSEKGNCILLNVLYSQITVNEEVTKALKDTIQKVKMELSN
jgi:hypothetical protein